jgi:hypothetical protein
MSRLVKLHSDAFDNIEGLDFGALVYEQRLSTFV